MKQLEVVAAILVYNNQILCMQRGKGKHDYTSYKYEFPGGKIEAGETKVQALQRELIEELDLQLTITEQDHFMTVEHTYPDFKVTLSTYLCKVQSQQFQLKEHIAYKWLDKEALDTVEWAAADLPILEKLKKLE